MQAYLTAIASQCSILRTTGEEPVVLVGRSAAATLLHEYRWGNEHWKCPLPTGITVSAEKASEARSIALINGVPVFEFETPYDDCFVLSTTMLKKLALAGSGADSALAIDWHAQGDDRLVFALTWKGDFLPAPG